MKALLTFSPFLSVVFSYHIHIILSVQKYETYIQSYIQHV